CVVHQHRVEPVAGQERPGLGRDEARPGFVAEGGERRRCDRVDHRGSVVVSWYFRNHRITSRQSSHFGPCPPYDASPSIRRTRPPIFTKRSIAPRGSIDTCRYQSVMVWKNPSNSSSFARVWASP